MEGRRGEESGREEERGGERREEGREERKGEGRGGERGEEGRRKRGRKEGETGHEGGRRKEREGREEERKLGWQKLPSPVSSQSLLCSWRVSGRASCTPVSEQFVFFLVRNNPEMICAVER